MLPRVPIASVLVEDRPLLKWLHGYPQLAARFLPVVDFPGYAPEQLSAMFGELADEAGLRLTVAARRKAAAVLEVAERGEASGNARLAVRLLNEVRAVQARRVSRGRGSGGDLAELVTITEADIPERDVDGVRDDVRGYACQVGVFLAYRLGARARADRPGAVPSPVLGGGPGPLPGGGDPR